MISTLLTQILVLSIILTFVQSLAHLSEAELRKGINVALTWKRLSFEQRKEMIENILHMPNFGLNLENELMKAITSNQALDKEEKRTLVKLIMVKNRQEFHEG